MNSYLEALIQRAKEIPGLTVSGIEIAKIPWNTLVDGTVESFIAKQADRDLEYDKHGNPVFMPKDERDKQKIRDAWKAVYA